MPDKLFDELSQTDNFFDELSQEADEAPASGVSLDAVNAMAQKAVSLDAEIEEIESKLSKLKTERYKLVNVELPAAMTECRVSSLTIGDRIVSCENYYKANIAADDPDDKRERAFAWVESNGGGDIINNVVTVAFPKELAGEAREFYEYVINRFHNLPHAIEVTLEKKVPWNRLTSWLKEFVETPAADKPPVPLEDLNATIGRVAKIKKVKSR